MLEKLEKFQILALAVVLALGGIIGAKIITGAMAKDVIYVTGSFSQNVISDSGRFEFTIHSRQVNKAQCFSTLNKQRPLVIKYLKDNGIQAVFHYIPLHDSPAGKRFGIFNGKDEFTTIESEKLIRLPMYYGLTKQDQDEVIKRIKYK